MGFRGERSSLAIPPAAEAVAAQAAIAAVVLAAAPYFVTGPAAPTPLVVAVVADCGAAEAGGLDGLIALLGARGRGAEDAYSESEAGGGFGEVAHVLSAGE